jgi:uncharacterized membrane protein YhaH (DUF805 family)
MGIGQLLFGFNGRIRRTNYWLGSIGAGFVLGIIAFIIVLAFGGGAVMLANNNDSGSQAAGAGLGIIALILYFAVLVLAVWISLALQIKRWHDRDKSGVWVLIGFIPLVGPFWVLIECGFLDGTMGPNRYGPSPKGIVAPPMMQPTGAYPPTYPPNYPPPNG